MVAAVNPHPSSVVEPPSAPRLSVVIVNYDAWDDCARLTRQLIDSAPTPTYHFVIVDFLARPVGGMLQAGDDAADARWLTPDEWATLPLTPGLAPVLDKAWRMAHTPDIWET